MSLTPRIDDIQPNFWINAGLDFWQRVTSASTVFSAQSDYTADRILSRALGSTTKGFSVARSSDVPSASQAGFVAAYSHLTTVSTAVSSFSDAADLCQPFSYRMEGNDYRAIHGQLVTLGFWIKVSQAGLYSLTLNGAGFTRSYCTSFNVSASGLWTFISKTIQMDSAGSYLFDTGLGLEINIAGMGGANVTDSNLNAWHNSSGSYSVPGAVNWMATPGATVQVSLPSITKGPIGLPASIFHRAETLLSKELILCQRYFEKSYPLEIPVAAAGLAGVVGGVYANDRLAPGISFKVSKRISPTVTIYDSNGNPATVNGIGGGVHGSAGPDVTSENGTTFIDVPGLTPGSPYYYQWIANSEL